MKQKGLSAETIKPGDVLEPLDKKGFAIPVMPDRHFSTNPAKAYWQADTSRYRADVKQMVLKDFTKACPEDFSGACEFAETDCFKRFKRHLTPNDLDDLQTVIWSEGARQKQSFGEWADGVLTNSQEKGDVFPIGNLPAKILRVIEKQPRLALLTVDDKQLVQLSKKSNAITAAEIKEIPKRLNKSNWEIDEKDNNYLKALIKNDDGSDWLKIAIKTNHTIGNTKKRIVNHIVEIRRGTDELGHDI